MDYVLFGIQGSGKGTQGKILMPRINASYFETGEELRRLSSENSPLGQKVKAIITAGRLAPNEVVMEIVENFIKNRQDLSSPIIFDGLPRNQEQSNSFTALLKREGRNYTGLYFELPRQEAENRLLNRRICFKCKGVYPIFYKKEACEKCGGSLASRTDDNARSIKTRLYIFYKETLPVIEKWAQQGKMLKIDGSKTIEEVTTEMMGKVKNPF